MAAMPTLYDRPMRPERPAFKMGRLDHVHVRVPDRAKAAAWYREYLGFEPVADYDFWATGFEGGPLQISADGGHTTLALFETNELHPMIRQETGVAFSVDADNFMAFAHSLPCGIDNPNGKPLSVTDLIDFDLCWAFEFVDPWQNRYELNCYEYDRVRAELVTADGIDVVRYWARDVYDAYHDARSS
jgi:catechol 2,3-dioxygenase-like lactoylglutathione lyase family enzyme